MADKRTPKISIGITSMTVILCVLCLTVFSVLSLSTAISEHRLAEKRAEAAKNYYAAESQAADLVNRVQTAWVAGDDLQVLMDEGSIVFEDGQYEFYKAIDDGQALHVVFLPGDELEIVNWQVVSTADWTPDESLKVWDGEMIVEE